MQLTDYPQRHPQVAARIMEGHAVIVLADSGQVSILNEVGTRIWDLIDGTRNVKQLVQVIQTEYDLDEAKAMHDVIQFLQSLLAVHALQFGHEQDAN